jgi:hypothetical protein
VVPTYLIKTKVLDPVMHAITLAHCRMELCDKWPSYCSHRSLPLKICTYKLRTLFRNNSSHLCLWNWKWHLKNNNCSIKSTLHVHLILNNLLHYSFVHVAPTFGILSPLNAYDDRHACALSASATVGTQCCSMQCSSSNGRWLHSHSCSTAKLQQLQLTLSSGQIGRTLLKL